MNATAFSLSDTHAAFGLSFIPPEALDPIARGEVSPPQALADAARELGAAFAFVPAGAVWAAEACDALQRENVAVLWAIDGPLWPVIESYGVQEGLLATLTAPDEVAARLDSRLDASLALVSHGVELGARAIVVAEDLAGSHGPLVAPDFAIQVLVPRLRRLVDAAAMSGLPSLLHSDGDIRLLLDAVVRAGFAGVHAGGGLDIGGFERLFKAARRAGLVVLGGMQTVELGHGFPAATELGARLGALAGEGGLLLADDGGITDPLQVTTLVIALMAARKTLLI